MIEETYARAYAVMVYEGQTAETMHLNKFLHTFLKSKFKKLHKTVNDMFCSIVYSAYHYKDKYENCDIFYKFVSDLYHPLELNYFIFLRAVIEKEFGQVFFEANSTKVIDVRVLHMSRYQIEHTVDQVFGPGNTVKISRFMQKLFDVYPSLRLDDKIKTYGFLAFALFDYYKCRRHVDRGPEHVKSEDQIAGITVSRLNLEQRGQGMNRRLLKGALVGSQLPDADLFAFDGTPAMRVRCSHPAAYYWREKRTKQECNPFENARREHDCKPAEFRGGRQVHQQEDSCRVQGDRQEIQTAGKRKDGGDHPQNDRPLCRR